MINQAFESVGELWKYVSEHSGREDLLREEVKSWVPILAFRQASRTFPLVFGDGSYIRKVGREENDRNVLFMFRALCSCEFLVYGGRFSNVVSKELLNDCRQYTDRHINVKDINQSFALSIGSEMLINLLRGDVDGALVLSNAANFSMPGQIAFSSGSSALADVDLLAKQDSLQGVVLWPQGDPLRTHFSSLEFDPLGSDIDWSPVIEWYEHLLDPKGKPLDPALLREIALIDPKTWDAGPAEALPVIGEIWERYRLLDLVRENPLALRIILEASSARLAAEPIEPRDMSQVVDDIRQALTEFLRRCRSGRGNLGPSMQTACQPCISELRRALSRTKSNPRDLLRLLEETRGSLAKIAENEGFQSDERLDRLVGNLQRREEDICVAAPEVLEEVKARMRVRVQLKSLEDIRAVTRLGAGMMADSEGMLRAALARAVIVINTEERSIEDRQAAWTFLCGAIPRGIRAMREGEQLGSDPAKDADFGDRLSKAADTVIKGDKAIDAVQEAVTEGGPLVTEAWTEVASGNLWGLLG